MDFHRFSSIPRLRRNIVVTEKLDGTNAMVGIAPLAHVSESGEQKNEGNVEYFYGPDCTAWGIWAGSRERWLTPDNDNFGFCKWVMANAAYLKSLGPGLHHGEWWGNGIQRNYGLKEKRFSLFNTSRWVDPNGQIQTLGILDKKVAPPCCSVVPELYRGPFDTSRIDQTAWVLGHAGSVAAPGFMKPEGIVVFHEASGHMYKQTLEHDEQGKTRRPAKDRPPKVVRDKSKGGRRIEQRLYDGPDRRVRA